METNGAIDGWIEKWAATDRVAISFEGDDLSYGRLHRRIGSAARGLVSADVCPGDRVLFCGLNRVELFEALFACARIGAIFCPLNNRLSRAELAFQLADSDPTILLTTDGFDSALAGAGAPPALIRDLDDSPFPDIEPPPSIGGPDSPVLMVYTSGTTGAPKGAVLTQDALLHTALNGIDHQDVTSEDCIVAPLPTFHVGGLNIQTLPTLLAGGRVILQRRFDPGDLLDLVTRYRPTQTLLVPAMLRAVADHDRFASTDLSCLRGITTGSSTVPEAVMRPYFDRGVPVGQVYGTTESGPTAVVLRYDEAAAHIGSCGRPARYTEVRVVDDAGSDVGPGRAGEVWLRGPNLFSFYWNDPQATADAFTDSWYRTGDVGHRDDDGYLFISDRLTDVVISGGENVYPAEVESVLVDHPLVAEVAVVGRADERWGETPVAVVVPTGDADLGLEELREWCDGRLARYKQPRELRIVEELPRTALGKVQKHVLRERLGLDRT